MARTQFSTGQIIGMLREAEVRISHGQTISLICEELGTSEQRCYRWRRDYGGLKLDQAKPLKDLEGENERLGKATSELTLAEPKLSLARRSDNLVASVVL